MRWFWRLRKEWRHHAEEASEEVETSRQNLMETRRDIVAPLHHWQEQNHFATLIKESLQLKNGHN